jgi:pimeloyl-[acyl-carrier protein] methyl ester esterase
MVAGDGGGVRRELEIVLLPGLDGSGQFFGKAEDYFKAYGRVRILNYPNTGEQSYEHLADLMLAQLPESAPFIVVAESFSGPLAIELAARNIAGLRGLLLVASFVTKPLGPLSALAARFVKMVQFMPIPSAGLIRWVLLGADQSSQAPTLRAFLLGYNRRTLIARATAALTCDVGDKLCQIDIPISALVAMQDRLITSGTAIWGKFTSVSVFEIDGPHFLLQNGNETQLNSAIGAFFDCIGDI